MCNSDNTQGQGGEGQELQGLDRSGSMGTPANTKME